AAGIIHDRVLPITIRRHVITRTECILALPLERFSAHCRWGGCAACRSVVSVVCREAYRVIMGIRIFARVRGHRYRHINRGEWGVRGRTTVSAKVKAIAVRIVAKRLEWDNNNGSAEPIYDDPRAMVKIHRVS